MGLRYIHSWDFIEDILRHGAVAAEQVHEILSFSEIGKKIARQKKYQLRSLHLCDKAKTGKSMMKNCPRQRLTSTNNDG